MALQCSVSILLSGGVQTTMYIGAHYASLQDTLLNCLPDLSSGCKYRIANQDQPYEVVSCHLD